MRSVENFDCQYNIVGASYVGNPMNNTVMFITKKIEQELSKLNGVSQCLVFHESNMSIPIELTDKHCFISCEKPQNRYAEYVNHLHAKRVQEDRKLRYVRTEEGYYIGEDVVIGENAFIEPNCLIGHHVRIGDNATILSNTVIKNAEIGDNFYANENSVIGANGFTMAKDETGNIYRVPTLGKVIIGNNVEIGVLNNVSCGSAGNTIIGDNVKLDALVHIPHDAFFEGNIEVPAGAIFGGFVHVESGVFIGVNSSIRNRIRIGKNAVIGMGAVVTKNVEPDTIVIGNPARPMNG